ncbi:MAG: hypothetical protein IJ773_04635 [Lachnospiraceae bacterium]|nr:hypothetical protein [Lachnospiraceae bacterium]
MRDEKSGDGLLHLPERRRKMNGRIGAEEIWYGRMGKTLRLLEEIRGCLLEERSAILLFPEGIFWEETFAKKVRQMAGNASAHRMFKELIDTGDDPGRLCLKELCSKAVRDEYWPGEPIGQFLGEKKEITFHNNFLLVRGICSGKSLRAWLSFIEEYEKHVRQDEPSAVFLLECCLKDVEGSLPVLRCETGLQDCHIFCLMAAEEAGTASAWTDYLAELAYQAGRGNSEFCARLLAQPKELFQNPVQTIVACAEGFEFEGGFHGEESGIMESAKYMEAAESKATSAVWKAQVVQLFPKLEQFRYRFISEHEAGLRHHLPIPDGNGEQITDPFDLEFGNLIYIVHMDGVRFAPSDWEKIQFCRAARNTLAHNKVLTVEEVEQVMRM